jgi:hypothetical protein
MNKHDPAHAATASLEANAVSLRHVLGEGFTSNGPLASAAVAFTATAAFGLGHRRGDRVSAHRQHRAHLVP